MYLKSIRVANYRVHQNTYLEFDRHLTLITGPNESGKSTLVDAMHRVLFMKARTTGENHKDIVSLSSAESPEVELTFFKNRCEYKLHKKFAAGRGTTLLTSDNQLNLRNDDAEEKLAELLSLQVNRYSRENWSHLWAWQGTSTDNQLTKNLPYQADLLLKLQHLGTAGLLQSNLDNLVNNKIRESYDTIFNKNGSHKTSSDVSKAEKTLEDCKKQKESKLERSHTLQNAARQYNDAEHRLNEVKTRIEEHDKTLSTYRQQQKQAAEIQQNLTVLELELKEKQKILDDFNVAQRKLDEFQTTKRNAEGRRKEIEPSCAITQQSLTTIQQEISNLTTNESVLAKLLRATRLQANLAQAAWQLTDKQQELQRLQKLESQIQASREQIADFKHQLVTIPKLTKNNLQDLKQLSQDILQAETSLRTMAASIKLLQSDLPVALNGQPLSPHTEYPISTPTELTIGDTTRIVITPGDGTSLTDAQYNLSKLIQQRNEKLDQLTVKSLEEAERFYDQHVDLTQKIKSIEQHLTNLDANQVSLQTAQSQERVTQLQSEQQRDTEILAQFLSAENIVLPELSIDETWQTRTDSLERDRDQLSEQIKTKRAYLENCQTRLNDLENERRDCDREIKTAIEGINQQTQILGDPAQRESAIAELQKDIEQKRSQTQQHQADLTRLQPEHLERFIQRQEMSLKNANQEKEDLISLRAEAMAKIRRDGSIDIYAELATAESAEQYAQSEYELYKREAEGLKLLKDIFELEQQKMSDALTLPFVQRMKKYAKHCTGEITQIAFEVTNNGFDQLRIVRPRDNNSAVDFEYLSGGAKEQFSAAARLAVAEVLASDSADGLPLIFDDAFSFTDSTRLEALPHMLQYAIDAGLQIIIVTCNPIPYTRLGAKTITLPIN